MLNWRITKTGSGTFVPSAMHRCSRLCSSLARDGLDGYLVCGQSRSFVFRHAADYTIKKVSVTEGFRELRYEEVK